MQSFRYIAAIATIIILQGGQAAAQGSFFCAGFGYGFPTGDRITIESPDGITRKNVYGSFGKGLSLGFNTGYMVNNNIGLDLGIWYVMGSTYEFETFDTAVGNVIHRVSGNTIRIMPAVRVSAEKKNKPYAKFGLLLGIATKLDDEETYFVSSSGGSTPVFARQEFTGGSSFGWMGAFGIDFSENQAASVYAEVNFCYQNYLPEMLTQYPPASAKVSYRFVDEPNAFAADEKLKPSFPFSTIGIILGVKFFSSFKKKTSTPASPN